MIFFKNSLLVGIGILSLHVSADTIKLSELTKGYNKSIHAGSTSGLVKTSVNSVNNISNKQYRDSQRYSSSSSSSSSYSSSSSDSSTSNSSNRASERASTSRSKGVKEIYNAGTKTKGFTNYRINCHSGRGKTVHKRSNGFWYDNGSNMGESYRHLSKQDFGNKYCK
jgi:hypothetical protein